ncbi:hypothetical protein ACJZ2D_011889 [Fusarium nematophilum]
MEFNSNLSMTGQASIELDYQRLNETAISTWQLREQELEERRNAYINVEIWLQSVHSSRPSPDTILNSLPQYMRQRVANEVVGRVDDVFSRSSRAATRGRPSSVQTTGASAVTVTSKRSAAASIIVPSFEERCLDRRGAVPPSERSSTPFGRKSKYHDTGNHDEGRAPETSIPLGGFQAGPSAPLGPRTRGVKEERAARPERQQVHWSLTNTLATNPAPTANQMPKRRNSRLTDDELAGKRRQQKRPKTVLKDCSRSQTPRASPSSASLPRSTTRRSPSNPPCETSGRRRRRTPKEASPTPNLQPPTLNTLSAGVAQNPKSRLLTGEDFTTACGTCFFWLHKPKLYSSRDACHRRKKEISHVITHAIDHHGLIRVMDPKNESRKFLISCQNHDPTIKASGNCAKCLSADQWTETDLADPEHSGIALCTRCWCSFDMRGMKEHMAEKLCPYNTEQPKPNKMCILYTTFCSETHPPSQPPEDNESDQRSPKSPSRGGQRKRQGARQQGQQHVPQAMPGAHPVLPNLQPSPAPIKGASSQMPACPPPSHSPLHAPAKLQRPPQPFTGSLSPQAWQPSIAEQPNQRNIVGYQLIYQPIYGSGPPAQSGATPALFPGMSTPMYQDRRGVFPPGNQPINQLAPSGQPSVTQQQPFTPGLPRKQQQKKRPPQKPTARSPHTTRQPQGIQQQQLPPQPRQQKFHEKRPQTAILDPSFHLHVSAQQTAQKSPRQPKLEHAQQHPVMSAPLEPIPQPRHFLDLANREVRACWEAVNCGANMPQLGTTPTIDCFPDGIPPLDTSLPQSAPSQNPPTNGDPGDVVPMSPNIDEMFDPDFSNVDWLGFMGSHLGDVPDLSYPTEQPPPPNQERPLGAPLPAGKQTAAETDSGFFSAKPESGPDWMDLIDFGAGA